MQYQARVVLDSLCVDTKRRLTTMELTYPRFIHAEFMTHRDRARNAASSRAIPFATLSKSVEKDPVFPLQWQSAQRGMQGGDEIPEALRPLARTIWMESLEDQLKHAANLEAIGATALALATGPCRYALSKDERDAVIEWVKSQSDAHQTRLHKTMPNRLIEPWMPITVVTTATEWKNFFRLRCHPDAEIHFQKIAVLAREALDASEPRPVRPGAWHLPYVIGAPDERRVWEFAESVTAKDHLIAKIPLPVDILCRISSARCARVSYMTHDGQHDPAKDLELFEKLFQGSGFGHWSPMEHPAKARRRGDHRSGPFVGWKQYRKFFKQLECADNDYEIPYALLVASAAMESLARPRVRRGHSDPV